LENLRHLVGSSTQAAALPMSSRSPRTITPQQRYEKEWLEQQMSGFAPTGCPAWRYLTAKYGEKISKEELLSLGQVAAIELELDLVREYKRRKETMIKWFQIHFDVIQLFLETNLEIIPKTDPRIQGKTASESSSKKNKQ
jgi:hypothetical protein